MFRSDRMPCTPIMAHRRWVVLLMVMAIPGGTGVDAAAPEIGAVNARVTELGQAALDGQFVGDFASDASEPDECPYDVLFNDDPSWQEVFLAILSVRQRDGLKDNPRATQALRRLWYRLRDAAADDTRRAPLPIADHRTELQLAMLETQDPELLNAVYDYLATRINGSRVTLLSRAISRASLDWEDEGLSEVLDTITASIESELAVRGGYFDTYLRCILREIQRSAFPEGYDARRLVNPVVRHAEFERRRDNQIDLWLMRHSGSRRRGEVGRVRVVHPYTEELLEEVLFGEAEPFVASPNDESGVAMYAWLAIPSHSREAASRIADADTVNPERLLHAFETILDVHAESPFLEMMLFRILSLAQGSGADEYIGVLTEVARDSRVPHFTRLAAIELAAVELAADASGAELRMELRRIHDSISNTVTQRDEQTLALELRLAEVAWFLGRKDRALTAFEELRSRALPETLEVVRMLHPSMGDESLRGILRLDDADVQPLAEYPEVMLRTLAKLAPIRGEKDLQQAEAFQLLEAVEESWRKLNLETGHAVMELRGHIESAYAIHP